MTFCDDVIKAYHFPSLEPLLVKLNYVDLTDFLLLAAVLMN